MNRLKHNSTVASFRNFPPATSGTAIHVRQIITTTADTRKRPQVSTGVPNTVGLYSINDFALSLKPVIHRVAVSFPSAQKEVIGTKSDFVFYDRFYQPVSHDYGGVHRGHLSAVYVPRTSRTTLSGNHPKCLILKTSVASHGLLRDSCYLLCPLLKPRRLYNFAFFLRLFASQ